MKNYAVIIMSVLMALALASLASAQELNIDADSIVVEVEGFELTEGTTTAVRQLERGEEFEVRVFLEAADIEDAEGDVVEDVEINAFITGYEHGRSDPISDGTRPFDLGPRESVVKTLSLTLPERADEDRYRLRVIISDRDSEAITLNYNIQIEPSDAEVVISDFAISPQEELEAGRALLATVRVRNFGDSPEDDVKIEVSIPELGLAATPDFLDELEEDESATSEEFFLRIPSCTRPGVYDVEAEVTFDEGDETVTETLPITITRGVCETDDTGSDGQAEVPGKTTLAFSTEVQSASAGGSVSFPITITNGGTSSRAFTISVQTPQWAENVRVSPSNLVTVRDGQTQTVYVTATLSDDASAGDHMLSVNVADSSGNVLQTIPFTARVSGNGAPGLDLGGLRDILTVGLIVVVALLVVIGLVLAFRRAKGDEGESQTYY